MLITRRGLIGSLAASSLILPARAWRNGSAFGSGFPGQPGNPVGYAATRANLVFNGVSYGNAAYPGSLTSHGTTGWVSGASPSAPNVYSFLDINAGSGGVDFSGLHNVTFIGCRFQSNNNENQNINVTGASSNLVFLYCSIVPLVSLHASPPVAPNGITWPSAGAGYNSYQSSYQLTTDGYEYGIEFQAGTGPTYVDHCDIWGGGNFLTIYATTQLVSITNNWVHDSAQGGGYHNDGVGYLNGTAGPSNVTVTGNTIGSLGNTNAIAFQAATSGYQNLIVNNNYFSGFGNMICFWPAASSFATGCQFENNVIGADVPWGYTGGGQILYGNQTAYWNSANNNVWRSNKFNIPAGTPTGGVWAANTPTWTSADNGKFVLPNNTLSVTDWTG